MNNPTANVFQVDRWKEVTELRESEAERFKHTLYHSPVKRFTPRAERVGRVILIKGGSNEKAN